VRRAGVTEALKSTLTTAERISIEAKLKEATALCNADKYRDSYSVKTRLARFIGHLEARKGIAPVL
jgi:hypothetical protein